MFLPFSPYIYQPLSLFLISVRIFLISICFCPALSQLYLSLAFFLIYSICVSLPLRNLFLSLCLFLISIYYSPLSLSLSLFALSSPSSFCHLPFSVTVTVAFCSLFRIYICPLPSSSYVSLFLVLSLSLFISVSPSLYFFFSLYPPPLPGIHEVWRSSCPGTPPSPPAYVL